jgi:hypothetical protein
MMIGDAKPVNGDCAAGALLAIAAISLRAIIHFRFGK